MRSSANCLVDHAQIQNTHMRLECGLPLDVRRWQIITISICSFCVFGKTQENLRNRVNVELVTDVRVLRKRFAKPSFYRGSPITDCLTVIQCRHLH